MTPVAHKEIAKDIAKGVSIICAIMVIAQAVPLIGLVGSLFLPLPIVFYHTKLGRTYGILIPAVAMAIITIASTQVMVSLLRWADLMLMGLVLSELFQRKLSVEKTVLYCCAIVLMPMFVMVLLYSNLAQISIFELIATYIANTIEGLLRHYEQIGLPADTIIAMTEELHRIQPFLVRLLPGMVIMTTLVITWANMLLARPMLSRWAMPQPYFGELNSWQAPDFLIWVLIGCGAATLMPLDVISATGLNGLAIILIAYFFQGIAIVAYFFNQKKVPKIARILLYTFIIAQQLLLLIIMLVGIFDTWFDFRKLNAQKDERP